MTRNNPWGSFALIAAVVVTPNLQAQTVDAIVNGDFASGTAGYTSEYTYAPAANSLFGANEGKYGIGTSPNFFHSSFITSLAPPQASVPPSSTAMIVNGYAAADSWIWAQPVQLTAGVPYSFSAWATSVLSAFNAVNNNAVPNLKVRMTAAPITPAPADCSATAAAALPNIAGMQTVVDITPSPLVQPTSPTPASDVNGAAIWSNGTATVTPTATGTYCLIIFNDAIVRQGNDFALTSISLTAAKPAAVDDTYATPFNTPLNQTATVGGNDTSLPPNPVYTELTGTSNGTLTFNPDGSFVYTPNTGFSGTDSFTYQVCAGPNNAPPCSDPATVTITVAPPVGATNDAFTTPENTPVSAAVGGNDGPLPATPVFSALTQPTNGTVTLNPDGTFTYTPNNGFNGTDSFTYQVCSGPGNAAPCSASATVTIRVGVTPVPALGLLGLLGLGAALGGVGMRRRKPK